MLFTAALVTVYKRYHIIPQQILLLNNLLFPLDLKKKTEKMQSPSEINDGLNFYLNLTPLPNKNLHIYIPAQIDNFFFSFC